MTDKTTPDPAQGGYFTVTDRRPTRFLDRGDFHVRGYARNGNLLLHTWHSGEHSMQMEVSAWLRRGALPRGEDAEKAAVAVREQDAGLQKTLKALRDAQP